MLRRALFGRASVSLSSRTTATGSRVCYSTGQNRSMQSERCFHSVTLSKRYTTSTSIREFCIGGYNKAAGCIYGHRIAITTSPKHTVRYKTTDARTNQQASSSSEDRMLIGFTCKVCNHRQHKTMSKNAYKHGVVLIQCDDCKNRHLIADNMGWFRDKNVNIQDLMKEKGEEVRQLKDMDLLDGIETEQVKTALEDYEDVLTKRNNDEK